jgi:hypothetical protein
VSQHLSAALQRDYPAFLAYGFAFAMIATWWMYHHRMFRLIYKYDTTLMMLNFMLLLEISVMPFVLGVKGSAWAWRNKRWESVDHFRRVQRIWAIAGVIFLIAAIAGGVAIWFSVMAILKNSEAYQMAVAQLQANGEVIDALGRPIVAGTPSGRIETSGPTGSADLQFSVEGPKGKGVAFLRATKSFGTWHIDRIGIQVEGRSRRIILGAGGDRVKLEDGSDRSARWRSMRAAMT